MPPKGSSIETVGTAVAEAASRLRAAGVADPRREAERLLAHLLDTDLGGIVATRPDPLEPGVAGRYRRLAVRRQRREPFQYLTGTQDFYGMQFRVDSRALIPRPETEGLVDAVLDPAPPRGARVLDVGTGSGCIAIALAAARPDLLLRAVDRSDRALALAGENARGCGVEQRIEFRQADLRRLPDGWRASQDVVVSNPPYVAEREWEALEPEVRDHEPRAALVAGPTGLEAYAVLVPAAFGLLVVGGRLVLEVGYGQAGAVVELAREAGFEEIEARPDLRGIPRVVVARRGAERERRR